MYLNDEVIERKKQNRIRHLPSVASPSWSPMWIAGVKILGSSSASSKTHKAENH